MPADSLITEALNRLEHKVDIALKLLLHIINGAPMGINKLPSVGDIRFTCPVCTQTPDYKIDPMLGVVTRKCGCGTGKVAINFNDFAPPTQPRRDANVGDPTAGQDQDGPNTGGSIGGAGKGGASRR